MATRIRRFRWVGVRYVDGEEGDECVVVQEGGNEEGRVGSCAGGGTTGKREEVDWPTKPKRGWRSERVKDAEGYSSYPKIAERRGTPQRASFLLGFDVVYNLSSLRTERFKSTLVLPACILEPTSEWERHLSTCKRVDNLYCQFTH